MNKLILSALFCVTSAFAHGAEGASPFATLPLGNSANTSRLDREAADGKGGWLDMGANDLHVLPAGRLDCDGIPFDIPADRGETDKTCIVLGRKGGAFRAELSVPDGAKGPCLYLLHATADSALPTGMEIGIIYLHYTEGEPSRRPVRTLWNVLDWTLGSKASNAARVWTKYNDNMQVSLFAARFPVDPARKLVRIEFEANGKCPWMIVAATLGENRNVKSVSAPMTLSQTFRTPPAGKSLPTVPAGRKPRNVILIIGDGMGEGAVDFTSRYCHGRPNALRMQQAPVSGRCKTVSVLGGTTDSAAAATAIATGTKTLNGMIGLGARSNEERKTATKLVSFAERAHEKGLAVGLLTSEGLTGATPAGFYGHVSGRAEKSVLVEQAASSGYEILIGDKETADAFKGVDMSAHGYAVVRTLDDFKKSAKGAKVFGSIDFGMKEDTLGICVGEMISRLAANPKGFFLMAESALPDSGGHGNDPYRSALGTVMADWMAAAALDFAAARGDTLVIVTADHETGRVRVSTSADGRAHASYGATNHTEEPVLLYAYGPGAEQFAGTIDNTDIAKKISALLNLDMR